jgi:hypothetical protein
MPEASQKAAMKLNDDNSETHLMQRDAPLQRQFETLQRQFEVARSNDQGAESHSERDYRGEVIFDFR